MAKKAANDWSYLPPKPADDERFQDKVNQAKTEITAPAPADQTVFLSSAHKQTALAQLLDETDQAVAATCQFLKRWTDGERRASSFTEAYLAGRELQDKLKELLSEANIVVEALTQLTCKQIEEEGLANCRLANNRGVTTFLEPYASVVDQAALTEWAKANGYENKLQLQWGTTNALTAERLKAGAEPPAGVKVFAKQKVRLLS